jgi:hypothetical protein
MSAAQGTDRRCTGESVDGQVVAALEASDGLDRPWAVDPVGGYPEEPLKARDAWTVVTLAQCLCLRARSGCQGSDRDCGNGGDHRDTGCATGGSGGRFDLRTGVFGHRSGHLLDCCSLAACEVS